MLLLPLPLHTMPACMAASWRRKDGQTQGATAPSATPPINHRAVFDPILPLNERTAPNGARAPGPSLASLPDTLLQQILGLLDQPLFICFLPVRCRVLHQCLCLRCV